jgi:hypothetical protein
MIGTTYILAMIPIMYVVSIIHFYLGFLPQPQVSHIAAHLPIKRGRPMLSNLPI